ncbi:MAG: 1,6-anhydro-N-acetylmuramyl-L-alanine amidase AmpD [bacterium]
MTRGVLANARQVPSPNCDDRPQGSSIDLLVIHAISLPPDEFSGEFVEAFFCNQLDVDQHPYFTQIADLQVSSHLYIKRDGELVQFVDLDRRAWHAGVSAHGDRVRCNDFSIGIELEGSDHQPFSDAQYQTLIETTGEIMNRYPAIDPDHIVGHCDIAPGRKTDPGPYFDWQRYRKALV